MPGATPAYEGSVATQASQTTPRGPRRRAATGAYTQLLHANPCSPFPFSLFLPVSSSYSFNESSSLIPPSRARSCFHRNYNLLISRRMKLGSIIRYNSFEYDICIKNFSRIGFLVPETANPRIKHKAVFLALTRRESNVKPDRIASNRMRGDTISRRWLYPDRHLPLDESSISHRVENWSRFFFFFPCPSFSGKNSKSG